MKHAFFQKATPTTLSVILHLSFHNPIMIGKKKSDVMSCCPLALPLPNMF